MRSVGARLRPVPPSSPVNVGGGGEIADRCESREDGDSGCLETEREADDDVDGVSDI